MTQEYLLTIIRTFADNLKSNIWSRRSRRIGWKLDRLALAIEGKYSDTSAWKLIMSGMIPQEYACCRPGSDEPDQDLDLGQ